MRLRAVPLLLAVVAVGGVGRAGLDEAEWRDVARAARRLEKTPGELAAKQDAVRRIAEDDSERAAKLLCDWAKASLRFRERVLQRALDDAQEDHDKLVKILLKAYDTLPPNRKEDKDAYDLKKAALDRARADVDAEDATLRAMASAFAGLRAPEAVAYLLREGERGVARREGTARLLVGMTRAYLAQPVPTVREALFDRLAGAGPAEVRVLVLDWIATRRPDGGWEAARQALRASDEEVVRRGAVSTIREWDDPRAVLPLIDALDGADGLLAEEIEGALHWFTGQSFERDVRVWRAWWAREGEAWLASSPSERHRQGPRAQRGGTTSFYGVETRSKRIVFVLDRSGSMEKPASDEESRRGPVTGRGGDDEPRIEGGTKIEVAKNQLAWSIRTLPEAVRFGVVFYSTEVETWKPPPELVPATPTNREAARAWFQDLAASGATCTFDALERALDYAGGAAGADTIFLLSDGSPTIPPGDVILEGEALEAAYAAFLEKNRLYRCVVHTIGVGPQHNRWLMERIARDTGGTYRAVGTHTPGR